MYSRLHQFLKTIAEHSYAEPRTVGHDEITQKAAEHISPMLPAGARILDVGSGSGPALEWFKKHGFAPVGIDINEDNIAACKLLGFEVTRCDQNNLPEEWSQSFDCVWARHVLEHSVAPFFTLNEFKRVLKPGGVLYLEVPAPGTCCEHETNRNHYSIMGERMWVCLLMRAGLFMFEQLKIQPTTRLGRDEYMGFMARKGNALESYSPPHIPKEMGWEMETMKDIFCAMLLRTTDGKPFRYLEIGVAELGTIKAVRDFLKASGIEGECVGTDMEADPFQTKEFSEPGIRLIHKETREALREEAPFNFSFIDGCHCYNHLKEDWSCVSERMKPGGIVAFHDTSPDYQGRPQHFDNSILETRRFLEESGLLDGKYEGWKLLADDQWNCNGITFVQKL